MQPQPSRKGKYAQVLKGLHSEQLTRLQSKHQQECDLLDDIRNFTKQRAALEKSYAEGLAKLCNAFLNKKIPLIPDLPQEQGNEKWNIWSVWRNLLDENEKVARVKLLQVEVFQNKISDDAKNVRTSKLQIAKKCLDSVHTMHKELQTSIQDLDKTKKLYFDEEHIAHDAREKAREAEEKLKKKKGHFFQSLASLQKNSAKLSAKRDIGDERATAARNDYILANAASNAHQKRFYEVELPKIIQIMEGDTYSKVAEYLKLMVKTEIITQKSVTDSFLRMEVQTNSTSPEYSLDCYLKHYPVLANVVVHEFEPCDGDTIRTISMSHNAAMNVNREAKKWCTRVVKETKAAKEYQRKLATLQALKDSGQKVEPNDPNGSDVETKIEEVKQNMRRSETSRLKAEARIEMLSEGGVNIEEMMKIADVECMGSVDLCRSMSSLSVRSDISALEDKSEADYDSDEKDSSTTPNKEQQPCVEPAAEYTNLSADLDSPGSLEADLEVIEAQKRIQEMSATWADPTQVDWGEGEQMESPPPPAPVSEEKFESSFTPPVDAAPAEDYTQELDKQYSLDKPPGHKCIALYSYQGQNADELSIVESEELEIVGEDDGDGWVLARNYKGVEGFIPKNYLELELEDVGQGDTSFSFSSVDYYVNDDPEPDPVPQEAVAQEAVEQPLAPAPAVTSAEESHFGMSLTIQRFCRALYDYDANSDEELSFCEGQVIKILKKSSQNSVDDGWWEGQLEGVVGTFPSLMVEECGPDGDLLTPEDITSPLGTAPPAFTPPEVPSFLVPPEKVIITQPTPDTETPTKKVITEEQRKAEDQQIPEEKEEASFEEGVSTPSILIDEVETIPRDIEEDESDYGYQQATEEMERRKKIQEEESKGRTHEEELSLEGSLTLDTEIIVTAPTPSVEDRVLVAKDPKEEEAPEKKENELPEVSSVPEVVDSDHRDSDTASESSRKQTSVVTGDLEETGVDVESLVKTVEVEPSLPAGGHVSGVEEEPEAVTVSMVDVRKEPEAVTVSKVAVGEEPEAVNVSKVAVVMEQVNKEETKKIERIDSLSELPLELDPKQLEQLANLKESDA